jgi:hypothetical protein
MLATARTPGTRIAPTSSRSAERQVRWRKRRANVRMTAAKRVRSADMTHHSRQRDGSVYGVTSFVTHEPA